MSGSATGTGLCLALFALVPQEGERVPVRPPTPPPAETGSITVTAQEPNGTPVEPFRFWVEDDRSGEWRVMRLRGKAPAYHGPRAVELIDRTNRNVRFHAWSPWHRESVSEVYELDALGALGPELKLTLIPRGRLRGRVLAGGEPVPGAGVELIATKPEPIGSDIMRSLLRYAVEPVVTESDGRFELPIVDGDDLVLRVRHSGRGAAEFACPDLGADRSTSERDFDLGVPASLRALVTLPEPVDEHLVALNGPLQSRILVRPDARGWIDEDRLVPGVWRIDAVRKECMRQYTELEHACGEDCSLVGPPRSAVMDYFVPFELQPGNSARTEIDFASEPPHILEGRLRIRRAEPWPEDAVYYSCGVVGLFETPDVWLAERGREQGLIAHSKLGVGEFRLRSSRPGTFDLTIAAEDVDSEFELTDRVTLSKRREKWRVDLEFVRIEVSFDAPPGERPELGYRWKGQGELRASCVLRGARSEWLQEGVLRDEVPAGEIELVLLTDPEPRAPIAVGRAEPGRTLYIEVQ